MGLYFGLITREDLDALIDNIGDVGDAIKDRFDEILDSDPFAGFGNGNASDPNDLSELAWATSGEGGLELEIVNALDDRWVEYFEKAILDWENGDPDALILSTSRANPDYDCSAIDGKMKVCNGDYDATGWRGVNELVWDNRKRIVKSTAKMNEFYLTDKSSDDEKQYTMCHEIGHGFGLMHTDENFMNAPLGDCMDYSHILGPNLGPGLINYQRLANMYGTVDGSRRAVRSLRHAKKEDSISSRRISATPAWVDEMLIEKRKSLVIGGKGSENGKPSSNDWTIIHKSELGEIHQTDLGGGYQAHVRVLLA